MEICLLLKQDFTFPNFLMVALFCPHLIIYLFFFYNKKENSLCFLLELILWKKKWKKVRDTKSVKDSIN